MNGDDVALGAAAPPDESGSDPGGIGDANIAKGLPLCNEDEIEAKLGLGVFVTAREDKLGDVKCECECEILAPADVVVVVAPELLLR